MFQNHTICVVIPALNEAATIGKVIAAVPSFVDHVVVIDDGSTDETAAIAHAQNAIVVSHKGNKGLGTAFKSGVQKVLELGGDVMVNMDADGQFNPVDIEKLITPIVNQQADFVTASRFKDAALYPQMSRTKFWGNQRMAELISNLVGQRFYDVSCGFRAYSRDTLLRLNLFGKFTYTQETFLDLAHKGLTIVEIPVVVRGTREFGQSRMASNLFNYAYRTSKIILQTLRDYNPFRLFWRAALLAGIVGTALSVFLLNHYWQTGEFSPHKWAGFAAAFFITLAMFILAMGFIMDMFTRMRQNQEEILYHLKSARYRKN